jgi:hypothetical protein
MVSSNYTIELSNMMGEIICIGTLVNISGKYGKHLMSANSVQEFTGGTFAATENRYCIK